VCILKTLKIKSERKWKDNNIKMYLYIEGIECRLDVMLQHTVQ